LNGFVLVSTPVGRPYTASNNASTSRNKSKRARINPDSIAYKLRGGQEFRRGEPNKALLSREEDGYKLNAKILKVENFPNGRLGRCFQIKSESENIYAVTVAEEPSCTCPDWTSVEPAQLRIRYKPCKHLYWVYNIHLKMNSARPIHCVTLSKNEVREMLQKDQFVQPQIS
jgi:hypothetical protein